MDIIKKVLEIAYKEMNEGGNKKEIWGSNSGPQVNKYLESVGITVPSAWCMAFVYYCVNRACQEMGVQNPLVKTGYCPDTARWAKSNKVYFTTDGFKTGDIFLLMDREADPWFHTGFVVKVLSDTKILTIEGNTNPGGSANGDGIYERERGISNTAFVGWHELIKDTVKQKNFPIGLGKNIISKAVILTDGKAYAPVRELCEALGYNVDAQKESIMLKKKETKG